jgi:hypothetical protein
MSKARPSLHVEGTPRADTIAGDDNDNILGDPVMRLPSIPAPLESRPAAHRIEGPGHDDLVHEGTVVARLDDTAV